MGIRAGTDVGDALEQAANPRQSIKPRTSRVVIPLCLSLRRFEMSLPNVVLWKFLAIYSPLSESGSSHQHMV